ncbi:hypothetical protein NL676_015279 [Syzygium grande]|nr:hypothetical protein NL676_015279 [Syzygium grande]
MDSTLEGKYHSKTMYEIAQLALSCVAPEPKSRPSMEEVVRTLETLEAATERAAQSRSGRPMAHSNVQHQLPLPKPPPMQTRSPLHSRHKGASAYQNSPRLRCDADQELLVA